MRTSRPGIPGRRQSSTKPTFGVSPFTPSSGVEHPGTYRGLIEKLPYLKTWE